jgi:LDH2 family malate/lactate/ureidoglycolate dehydrogenase
MSGHKGYGLALLMESLAGVLSGANLTWNVKAWISDSPSEPTHHGAGFLAFNVGVMQDINEFLDRVDGLIDEIHGAPKVEGIDRIYVPGEMEWERREIAKENGITLPPDVVMALRQMTREIGLETSIV